MNPFSWVRKRGGRVAFETPRQEPGLAALFPPTPAGVAEQLEREQRITALYESAWRARCRGDEAAMNDWLDQALALHKQRPVPVIPGRTS
jgi:hypothetical protein